MVTTPLGRAAQRSMPIDNANALVSCLRFQNFFLPLSSSHAVQCITKLSSQRPIPAPSPCRAFQSTKRSVKPFGSEIQVELRMRVSAFGIHHLKLMFLLRTPDVFEEVVLRSRNDRFRTSAEIASAEMRTYLKRLVEQLQLAVAGGTKGRMDLLRVMGRLELRMDR